MTSLPGSGLADKNVLDFGMKANFGRDDGIEEFYYGSSKKACELDL